MSACTRGVSHREADLQWQWWLKDPLTQSVLNGRQLALKISANSAYGLTNTTVALLLPVVFCVFWSRQRHHDKRKQGDEHDEDGPKGILLLASCPEHAKDKTPVLEKAQELIQQHGQLSVAGSRHDAFHQWLGQLNRFSKHRWLCRLNRRSKPTGEQWRFAYAGKLEASFCTLVSLSGEKTRKPCFQFVTIRGGPQCDWEREVLEHESTKKLFCHTDIPVHHFENLSMLADYMKGHQRTGTLCSATLRMHWRIEDPPDVKDWGPVIRLIEEEVIQLVEKEMATARHTFNFATGGYRGSANFVCMAYIATTARVSANKTNQDQYATMKELERLCEFHNVAKSIENMISKTNGLACSCCLHDISIVASRLAHTLQALSQLTPSSDSAVVSVIRSSLHSLASVEDGGLLVPKMLELDHTGNSLQRALANFALHTITSAGLVLADGCLQSWERMKVREDLCIQARELTSLQENTLEHGETSQQEEKQEERQEAPTSASSKEMSEHEETSQHEEKHEEKEEKQEEPMLASSNEISEHEETSQHEEKQEEKQDGKQEAPKPASPKVWRPAVAGGSRLWAVVAVGGRKFQQMKGHFASTLSNSVPGLQKLELNSSKPHSSPSALVTPSRAASCPLATVPTKVSTTAVRTATTAKTIAAQKSISVEFIPAKASSDDVDVLISVVPPLGTQRTPSDFCCVIGVSDSIGEDAVVEDSSALVTCHGLEQLDAVKHAVRLICNILGEHDRLALVSYGTMAKTILDLTPMTPEGKAQAERSLNLLQPHGMTNTCAGLDMGIGLLSCHSAGNGRLQHLLLLTGGVPAISPPQDIMAMLKQQKKKADGTLSCIISTFGFGSDLDSKLLQDIAAAGYGSYAFIPDASFVGTVFVHAIANLLATLAYDVVLELESVHGAAILYVHKPEACACKLSIPEFASVWGDKQRFELRSLQFGQSRDLLIVMAGMEGAGPAALQATLHYRTQAGEPSEQIFVRGCGPAEPAPDGLAKLERERCRIAFIEGLAEAMSLVKLAGMNKTHGDQLSLCDAQHKLKELEAQIADYPGAQTHEVQCILEDLRGQVAKAFSREDWFTKWGVHFLPSLLCAHVAQQCSNCKDPGVQQYGGHLFAQLRDEAHEIFERLPAPTPTMRQVSPT